MTEIEKLQKEIASLRDEITALKARNKELEPVEKENERLLEVNDGLVSDIESLAASAQDGAGYPLVKVGKKSFYLMGKRVSLPGVGKIPLSPKSLQETINLPRGEKGAMVKATVGEHLVALNSGLLVDPEAVKAAAAKRANVNKVQPQN